MFPLFLLFLFWRQFMKLQLRLLLLDHIAHFLFKNLVELLTFWPDPHPKQIIPDPGKKVLDPSGSGFTTPKEYCSNDQ